MPITPREGLGIRPHEGQAPCPPLSHRTSPAGRHGWAELLTLVGAVRRLAFDRSLPPPEALGRIRDAYQDYDRQGGVQAFDNR